MQNACMYSCPTLDNIIINTNFDASQNMRFTAVARTLIEGGEGVYSYIHVLPDSFLLKSNSNLSI